MLKKLKYKIQGLIKTRRINVFLLFLALAFAILLLTKLSQEYTNTFVFGIDLINIPDEEEIIDEDSRSLEITMKAHGFELLRYYFLKPKLTIDFSSAIDKTPSKYIWTKNKAFARVSDQFNKNIEILNIVPDSLYFKYDMRAVKLVPIHVLSDLRYSPGYNLSDSLVIEPDSIKIIGANSIVQRLDKVYTDTLKLRDVKTDIEERINIMIPDSLSNLKFSREWIEVAGKVEKHTEGTVSVDVEVVNVPESIRLKHFPKSVHVSFYTSLANFNTIDSGQFRVICDFSKRVTGQPNLIPELVDIPRTVKYAKIKEEFIEYIIAE